MKKIVIIGATGKVGSQVSKMLLAQNQAVTLIARHKEHLISYAAQGANILATSVLDVERVTEALKDANVVLTMIASNHLAEDFLEDQRMQADAQIEAIKKSGIRYVVNLSSNGCQVQTGNGVIQGLSEMEVKLNELSGVNVIHLRPSFFMENTFYALDLIKHKGIYGLPLKANSTFPMIATKDVAKVVVEKLSTLNFEGKSILPILGPKDYSIAELAEAIGKAIGKNPLPYIQFPVEDFINGVKSTGSSLDYANRFAELMVATDNGLLNSHPRTSEYTTPTTVEEFASTIFAPIYANN